MFNETEITSLQNPRVKALVKLRDQRGRRLANRFIAEGHRAVDRAIAAKVEIESIWVCNDLYSGLPLKTPSEVEVVFVSAQVFKKIAYVRDPEGLLAVCVPPDKPLSFAMPRTGEQTIDLVAVGTEKPGNLGAMVRTADLAGCRAVIAAGTPLDRWNPNTIRASTGAVFTMPVLQVPEDVAIETMIGQHIRIFAAVVDGEVEHTQADYTAGPCAIVIGPEDIGLSDAWKQAAKDSGGATVAIATAGQTADSLNASVAAGVLLFEAQRQRKAAGLQ